MKCEQCQKAKGTKVVYSEYGFKHYWCQECFEGYGFEPVIQTPIAEKVTK